MMNDNKSKSHKLLSDKEENDRLKKELVKSAKREESLENKLLQMNEKLQEIACLRKLEFIEDVEPNLVKLIAILIDRLDAFSESKPIVERQEELEMISNISKEFLNFFNPILKFNRVYSDIIPLFMRIFNFKQLLNNIYLQNKQDADEKKLNFEFKIDQDVPPLLIGDKWRLNYLLTAFIHNAIEFTPEGCVNFHVKNVKKVKSREIFLQFFIKDQNVCFSKERKKQAKKKQERKKSSFISSLNSTFCVDLCIIKRLIDELKGNICFDSQFDQGVEVKITLPFKIPSLEEITNANMLQEEEGLFEIRRRAFKTSYRVLVVEDDRLAQMAAKDKLEKLGCIVNVAEKGEKALKKIKEHAYDLILMDLDLPDQDGITVSQKIQYQKTSLNQQTPIVALTAHATEAEIESALAVGIIKVLNKPLMMNALQKIIMTILIDQKREKGNLKEYQEIPSIDLNLGAKLVGGNQEKAYSMLSMLVNSLESVRVEMEIAYQDKKISHLVGIVHKLYGGASYCGVPRLTKALHLLESALKSDKYHNIAPLYKAVMVDMDLLIKKYKTLSSN